MYIIHITYLIYYNQLYFYGDYRKLEVWFLDLDFNAHII